MAFWTQRKGMQAMSKKRFTAEQIIPKLRETEVDQAKGRTVAQACSIRSSPHIQQRV